MARKKSRKSAHSPKSTYDPLSTAGEVLKDGRIAEVVQPKKDGALALLVWDGKSYAIRSRVCVHGQQLFVPAIQGSVFERMRLPRAPRPFDSVNWLLNCISENVSKYSGLSPELGKLIARFCLCSWLGEALPSRLSLHIIGPVTNAGIALLDLLSCFCRHPLFLAEINVNSIALMPRGLCPTVLYSGRLNRRTRNLLDSFHMRSKVVRARGQITALDHMVVTYSSAIEDLPNSPAAIEVPILAAQENCPPLSRSMIENLAEEFQSRLLSFRLRTLALAGRCDFYEPSLQFPMRELAKCLACCTPESPELQSELAILLAESDQRLRMDHSTTPESLVIEALLFFLHEGVCERVHVGAVTQVVNEICSRRGERAELKARFVGHVLRSLGFNTKHRDASGRGIFLLAQAREFIHCLARKFAVPSVTSGPTQCELCAKS